MTYQLRIVDAEITELSQDLPAIALEGPKLRRATQIFDLDLPATRELIAADFSRLDRVTGTVLIDERQHLPAVWDHVRRRVDSGAVPGRYLLTGSALPTNAPSHSGAGRIVQVRMRPLSLAERGLTETTVSLAELLRGRQEPVTGSSPVDLAAYVEEILASGFPGIRRLRGCRALTRVPYFQPMVPSPSHRETARCLGTCSNHWSRRACGLTPKQTKRPSTICEPKVANMKSTSLWNAQTASPSYRQHFWDLEPNRSRGD